MKFLERLRRANEVRDQVKWCDGWCTHVLVGWRYSRARFFLASDGDQRDPEGGRRLGGGVRAGSQRTEILRLVANIAESKLEQPVSVFFIGRDGTGKLKGSLRMPVGLALKDGVVVGVEDREAFKVPYAACHRIGCFAPFDLSARSLGELKSATNISVVAHSVSHSALRFNFSGRGFARAYDTYIAWSK
jgi:hypothetical protein